MSDRDSSISIVRLIALLMIITCHIFQGLNLEAAFWFNLGVQIFFFMSGYLYGNKEITNIKSWYIKQIKKILIPYIILCLIIIFIDGFFFNIYYSKFYIIGNILGLQGFIGTLKPLSHTWFVSYLLLCYLLTPLLQKKSFKGISEKKLIIFLTVIALLLQIIQFYSVVQIIAPWVFNYILGYYFSRYYIKGKKKYINILKKFTIFTLVFLIIRIIFQYNILNIQYSSLFSNNLYLINYWSHVSLGSCIFLWLNHYLKNNKIRYNKLLVFSDKYSYYIYLVHQMFILNHMAVLKLTNNIFVNIILILLLSTSSSVILYAITKLLILILEKGYQFFKTNIISIRKIIKKNEILNRINIFLNKRAIIINIFSIIIFSYVIMKLLLNLEEDPIIINSYYENMLVILLNWLPIFIAFITLYILTNRVYIGFILSYIFFIVLGLINYLKLIYRLDILLFSDVTNLKEALIMNKEYNFAISSNILYPLIYYFIIIVIVSLFINKKSYIKLKAKALIITAIIIGSLICHCCLYENQQIYNNIGDKSLINIWIGSEQYRVRGFIYSFVRSIAENNFKKPEKYSSAKAKKNLDKFLYSNISDNQKVNIIIVMLEAYADFSEYKDLNIAKEVYANLNKVKAQSYSGTLVSAVFGGGTIDTERKFLTGYYSLGDFRKKTNSYVKYFDDQGYYTLAMHPCYGSFYNRLTVNSNIGFDNYLYVENYFENVGGIVNDDKLFNEILYQYEARDKKIPYFNFNVTYQNHGPYSDEEWGNEYFSKDKISSKTKNVFNNYLNGIKLTNHEIINLVEYFKPKNEPTILLFFGDHKPFLGENGYQDLKVNVNPKEIIGYLNTYTVPYIIYANEQAKEIFGKNFVGQGNTISPNYLMNELFDYVGWKGNEYLQYTSEVKKKVDVTSGDLYKFNNKYYRKLDYEKQEIIDDYINTSYFEQTY